MFSLSFVCSMEYNLEMEEKNWLLEVLSVLSAA